VPYGALGWNALRGHPEFEHRPIFTNFILRNVHIATVSTMSSSSHPLLKVATLAVALTLLFGFVLFRHQGGSTSLEPLMAALSLDSPETKAATKRIRIDSFYLDESLPSSKSSMVIPPDHPAFQQPQVWIDSASTAPALPSSGSGTVFPPEEQQRRMLSSSKSGPVFEPRSAAAIINDSALKDAKTQDTLK